MLVFASVRRGIPLDIIFIILLKHLITLVTDWEIIIVIIIIVGVLTVIDIVVVVAAVGQSNKYLRTDATCPTIMNVMLCPGGFQRL